MGSQVHALGSAHIWDGIVPGHSRRTLTAMAAPSIGVPVVVVVARPVDVAGLVVVVVLVVVGESAVLGTTVAVVVRVAADVTVAPPVVD